MFSIVSIKARNAIHSFLRHSTFSLTFREGVGEEGRRATIMALLILVGRFFIHNFMIKMFYTKYKFAPNGRPAHP